jgi:hypothetical protein
MTFKSIAIAAALTFSSTALAGPISYGTQSGKLTRGETIVLIADKAALSRAKTAAMRDGRITARERAQIAALERKLMRDTRVLMNNRVRR